MNNPLGISPSKGKQGFDSHRGQKIFSLPRVVPCFPLLGLMPGGLFMGLSSTIIYTSELILCSTTYVVKVCSLFVDVLGWEDSVVWEML